jgi:hypothetical protein
MQEHLIKKLRSRKVVHINSEKNKGRTGKKTNQVPVLILLKLIGVHSWSNPIRLQNEEILLEE